jgi:hypothetical protein
MKTVQNEKPAVEDVQPVIDEKIVDTVYEIFNSITRLNALQDCFEDLANRLIADLHSNSFMQFDLDLREDQKAQLRKAISIKGHEVVKDYLASIDNDKRSKEIYGLVRQNTTRIVDNVLSAIGQEINRGAVINATAVQANAKSEEYDEILLRKTKTSGDITIPTNCLLISTNCIAVIKASCQEEKDIKSAEKSSKEKSAKGTVSKVVVDKKAGRIKKK